MLDKIKKVAMQVQEELTDSENYIRCACKYREHCPTLAELYLTLSGEELSHAERLHAEGTRMLNSARSEEADYKTAETIWQWEKGKVEQRIKEIKVQHEMFRK